MASEPPFQYPIGPADDGSETERTMDELWPALTDIIACRVIVASLAVLDRLDLARTFMPAPQVGPLGVEQGATLFARVLERLVHRLLTRATPGDLVAIAERIGAYPLPHRALDNCT